MGGEDGEVRIVLDDEVRLGEAVLDIPLDLVHEAQVPLLGGIVAAPGGEHVSAALVLLGADGGEAGIQALAQVHDEGQDLPVHLQGADAVLGGLFRLRHHDGAHLLVLLMGHVAQIGDLGAEGHAPQTHEVRIVPQDDIHHPGNGAGLVRIDGLHPGVGVGAAEEFRMEHIRRGIVDAELRNAGGQGIREDARLIGLADDPEIFPLAVDADYVCHLLGSFLLGGNDLRRLQNGLGMAGIGAADADISGKGGLDLRLRGVGVPVQQGLGGD